MPCHRCHVAADITDTGGRKLSARVSVRYRRRIFVNAQAGVTARVRVADGAGAETGADLMADGARVGGAGVAGARRAAAAALRDACERQIIRTELQALETYTDAWGRYAQALEVSVQTLSPAGVAHGQRPQPLPPIPTTAGSSVPAEQTAEEMCAGIAAHLQGSLGPQQWSWHGAHAGETATVPLAWLRQIEEGVRLLKSAATREAALQHRLADALVRADAAGEQSACHEAALREAEEDLEAADARIHELEGGFESGRNTLDSDGGDADGGRGCSADYDAYEPFGEQVGEQAGAEAGAGEHAVVAAAGMRGAAVKGEGGPGAGGSFWNRWFTSSAPPAAAAPEAEAEAEAEAEGDGDGLQTNGVSGEEMLNGGTGAGTMLGAGELAALACASTPGAKPSLW